MFRPRLGSWIYHMRITCNPVHLNYFHDSGVLDVLIHVGICITKCQVFWILETVLRCYNLIYFNNLTRILFCKVIVCLWKCRPALKFCEEPQRMFFGECNVPFSSKSQRLSVPLLYLYSIMLVLLFPHALKSQEVRIYPSPGTFFSELRVCKLFGEAKEAFKIHYRAHEHRWGFYLV